jgi:cysteine synthase A
VVDPEGSAYAEAFATGCRDATASGSRIEGIGRPRVEESFLPSVVDEVLSIGDARSVAAMRILREHTGIAAGPSTGTNLAGALALAARMVRAGETGSIVTLVCDSGDRYAGTFWDDAWLSAAGLDPAAELALLRAELGAPAAALGRRA